MTTSNFAMLRNVYPLADALQMRLGLSVPKKGKPKIVNLGDPIRATKITPWLSVPTEVRIKASHVSKDTASILFKLRGDVYGYIVYEKGAGKEQDGFLYFYIVNRREMKISDTMIAGLDGADILSIDNVVIPASVASFSRAQRASNWLKTEVDADTLDA